MGRQHRSSKLLNKAANLGGKLTLYTELNHTLSAGDYVYISGGYYDNTTDNVYSSIWLTSDNIFTNQSNKSYKVLSVNAAQNSITLDVNVSGTPKFPYCSKTVTTNVYADPTNAVDPAYASEAVGSGDSAYFHVYVSQVFNGATRVKKGNINNGIFGTDVVLNYIGNKLGDGGVSSMKNDLTINHIAAKRIKLDYGVVTSKSFNTEPTTKFKVNYYAGYSLSQESIANNNEGQGYSYFQTAFLGSIYSSLYNDVELKASKIGNGGYFYNSGVSIINALISGAYIGTDVLTKPDSTVLTDCKIINSSLLYNVKFEKYAVATKLEDSSYYSGNNITLTPTSSNTIIFDGTDTITFTTFDPSIFASKKLVFSPTHKFYLLGIKDQTTGEFVSYLNCECVVSAYSYTYGSATSGSITIKFNELAANSADFISNYTFAPGPGPGTYYCDNIILSNLYLMQGGVGNDHALTNVKVPYVYARNNTINMRGIITNDPSTPTGRVTLIGRPGMANINVFDAYINKVNAVDTVLFNYGYKVIYDLHQLLHESSSVCYFDNCIFKPDTTSGLARKVYSGVFTNCLIFSGNFTNSDFYNSRIVKTGATSYLFLYNSRILTTSYVDENVEWELINFNPFASGSNYPVTYSYGSGVYTRNKHGYFQGRLSSFIVGNTTQVAINSGPLNRNNFTYNLNNTKTHNFEFFTIAAHPPTYPTVDEYTSAPTYNLINPVLDPAYSYVVKTDIKLVPMQRNTRNFIHPALTPVNGTIALFNLGHVNYGTSPYSGYIPTNNFNYLMLAETKSVNTALKNAGEDEFNNYPISINPVGTGTLDPDLSFSDGNTTWGAKSNSVYLQQNYHKYNVQNVAKKQSMMFWSSGITQPNPVSNFSKFFDVNFKAKGLTSMAVTNLTSNATTTINETVGAEGSYLIYFEHMAWFDSFGGIIADNVTYAYMEIDSIIVEEYNAINGDIINTPSVLTHQTDPTICNSISALAYSNNTFNDFNGLLTFSGNTTITNYKPAITTLTVTPGKFYKIEVNIQIYSYNLTSVSMKSPNCGKSEFRKYYMWLEFT